MVQLTHRPLRTHLTGRARTRKSFWGNQILEVEVRTDYYQGFTFIYSRLHWRDASQNDLNECILRFWNPVEAVPKKLPEPERWIGPKVANFNPPPTYERPPMPPSPPRPVVGGYQAIVPDGLRPMNPPTE